MVPEEMVGYMNGATPEENLYFTGAWRLMAASPGFDAAMTDWVIIAHQGGGGGPLAFFTEGVMIRWEGWAQRWTVDRSGVWASPDGRLQARYNRATHTWERASSAGRVALKGGRS